MEDVTDVAAWVRSERERQGLTAAELAERTREIAFKAGLDTKLSQQSISALETGTAKRVPPWYRYVREALTGEKAAAAASERAPGLPKRRGEVAPSGLDLVPIAVIDLEYGMGGSFTDSPVEVEVQHFPRVWIESITHSPPELLTFARGRGDSMKPTINHGDLVLIDRSQRVVEEQDAFWALTVGDIGMIKRLRIKRGRVQIHSDNELVEPDEEDAGDVNIVGRIVFIGRRV